MYARAAIHISSQAQDCARLPSPNVLRVSPIAAKASADDALSRFPVDPNLVSLSPTSRHQRNAPLSPISIACIYIPQ